MTPGVPPWRVGDVVEVDERVERTDLGQGVVIDLATDAHDLPTAARVRFDHGPFAGVWYSLGTLRRLRDLEDRPIADPLGREAARAFEALESPTRPTPPPVQVRVVPPGLSRHCIRSGCDGVPWDRWLVCRRHMTSIPRYDHGGARWSEGRPDVGCTFWHECRTLAEEGDRLCAEHRGRIEASELLLESRRWALREAPPRRTPVKNAPAAPPQSAPERESAPPASPLAVPPPLPRGTPRVLHLRHLVLRGWIQPGANARALLALAEVNQLRHEFQTLPEALAWAYRRLQRLGWFVGRRPPVDLPPLVLPESAWGLAPATRERLRERAEAARGLGLFVSEAEREAWVAAWLEEEGYDPALPVEPAPDQALHPRDVLDLGLGAPGATAEPVARALAAQRAGAFQGREAGLAWLRAARP